MMELDYIEVKQPIGSFYLCSISAKELLNMVNTEPHSKQPDGVQRDLSSSRVREIGEYCSDPDAIFPTPIVVSIYQNAPVSVDYEKKKICIDNNGAKVGDVIDGQHRLWGIKSSSYVDEFSLPVVLMFDLTTEQKAYVFSTINSNQVKVPTSLIYDLFDVSKERSPYKTVHQIARLMNNASDSPFYNRLKMLGKKEPYQHNATLSQGTFAKSLLQLISKNPDDDTRRIKRGESLYLYNDDRFPFRGYFIEGKDEVISKILMNCFGALRDVFLEEWKKPQDFILWKTTGYRAVIYALPSMIRKGVREKVLTKSYFALCFTAFKKKLQNESISLTSKDFPSGGEQNQKKLAKHIIDAVSGLNVEDYMDNLIKPNSFAEFMEKCGNLSSFELYELAKILKGETNSSSYFDSFNNDDGLLEIIYPFYDAAIKLSPDQMKESLNILEGQYMDGMDADMWYEYMKSVEKNS